MVAIVMGYVYNYNCATVVSMHAICICVDTLRYMHSTTNFVATTDRMTRYKKTRIGFLDS